MKEGGDASDKPIDSAVLSRLKQFRAMNKMKKLALKVPQKEVRQTVRICKNLLHLWQECFNFLKVIAESLSEEEIKGLKQMFKNMDVDDSGKITFEELKTGLSRLGSKLNESEIKQLMDAVSAQISF